MGRYLQFESRHFFSQNESNKDEEIFFGGSGAIRSKKQVRRMTDI